MLSLNDSRWNRVTMRALTAAIACCVLTLAGAAAVADAARRVQFNIEAQPLTTALVQFSDQAGLQFTAPGGLLGEVKSTGVRGEYSTGEALAVLLEGTGFTYRFVDEGTVAITEVGQGKSAGVEIGKETRFAQAEGPQGTSSGAAARESAQSAQNAAASSEGAQDEKLEEITVTAQKRVERLQDVPISISVLGGKELDKFTGEGVNEALLAVPGVKLTESWQGVQLSVRGVSASGTLLSGSSPVAYYIDSVPFGFVKSSIGPDTNAYDLQRVEVLRGPQGTLYGANALNGVVRVLTNDPDLSRFDFKARTSVASIKGGQESYRGDLAFNVPLIEDKLATRLVLGYADFGGWIDKVNEEDANDRELSNIRLKIAAQPTEKLAIGLSAWRSRSDSGAQSLADENDQFPGSADSVASVDFDILGLKAAYEFEGFSISSMTSSIDFSNRADVDISPFGFASQYDQFDSEVFAEEILINSTRQGPWRWSLGGFYRDAEDRFFQRQALFFNPDVDYGDTSKSFAVFGEVTRMFADGKFELTGGLRYFEDDVSQRVRNRPLPAENNTFGNVSPRLILTWHAGERLTAYASYAEGFRSGFDQSPATVALAPPGSLPQVKEDKLNNYELGIKSDLLDGRMSYETAVYYIDWQDVQQEVCINVGILCFIGAANGASASGPGVDMALTVRPVEKLQLSANFSWNDLTMDEPLVSGSAVLLDEGDRLKMSAKYTVAGSAAYAFPLGGSGLEGRIEASASYSSKLLSPRALQPDGTTRQLPSGDPARTSRTGFSIGSPEHWSAELFVDNISNDRGAFDADAIPFFSVRQRPRMIGVQFEYRY